MILLLNPLLFAVLLTSSCCLPQPEEPNADGSRKTLGLTGDETVSIHGLDNVTPLAEVPCTITYADGSEKTITLKCRIDTAVEIDYIENGGVLHYVLRNLARAA